MKWLCWLCLFGAMLGCTSVEPTQADRDACISAGHAPGTEAFETCLRELLARRLERPTGAEIDELRTRMGPRLRHP